MISFFILFGLMLLFSSFFIVGFYNITRGRWETKPDSSRVWKGKIFNFWHRFLQSHTIKHEFYTGDEFFKVLAKLKPLLAGYEIKKVFTNAVEVDAMSEQNYLVFKGQAHNIGILVNGVPSDDKTRSSVYFAMQISAYKEVPHYKISRYITDPLGMCITCLSSFYGTLLFAIWWVLMAKAQVVYPTKPVEFFLSLGLFSKAALWVVFCISLTYFNDTLLNIKKYFGKE